MKKQETIYSTPECNVIHVHSEGVLCGSQDSGNDGFTIDDFAKESGSWD